MGAPPVRGSILGVQGLCFESFAFKNQGCPNQSKAPAGCILGVQASQTFGYRTMGAPSIGISILGIQNGS